MRLQRPLALILCLALLFSLHTSLADDIPTYTNLSEATNYVATQALNGKTEVKVRLSVKAVSGWSKSSLISLFADAVDSYSTSDRQVSVNMYNWGTMVTVSKIRLRDGYRMATAHLTHDRSGLSASEKACLDRAISIVNDLRAKYGYDGVGVELASMISSVIM